MCDDQRTVPSPELLEYFRQWGERAAMMRELRAIEQLPTVPHPKGAE